METIVWWSAGGGGSLNKEASWRPLYGRSLNKEASQSQGACTREPFLADNSNYSEVETFIFSGKNQ